MFLDIHPDNPNPRNIAKVIDCLKSGGVIIYPTDTVYGLGCDISHHRAVEKVAQIKGISLDKANFSFICSTLSHLSDYTKPLSNSTFKMMKRNLPGPFTFILNANGTVPKIFKNKKKTVGIRVPDNNICQEIISKLGNPIVSTSIHDEDDIIEYTTDPELIYEKYGHQVDIVINGGFGNNVPSTVIDCTNDDFEVLRQGIGELIL